MMIENFIIMFFLFHQHELLMLLVHRDLQHSGILAHLLQTLHKGRISCCLLHILYKVLSLYHPSCSFTNDIKSKYISRVRSFVFLSNPVFSAS